MVADSLERGYGIPERSGNSQKMTANTAERDTQSIESLDRVYERND